MDPTEMVADLENKIARASKPWMRILAAILLVGGTGFLLWQHLSSLPPALVHASASVSGTSIAKSTVAASLGESLHKVLEPRSERTAEEKAKASEQFGAALEKAGIPTQAGPSQK